VAVRTPGLNEFDRKVLDAIAEWYRRLYVEDFAGSLSHVRMARRLDVDPVRIRWAVEGLVGVGLIAVKPAACARANTYLPALPKRLAASLAAAVAASTEDAAPPF
jgi:hypothetical protein